VRIDTLVHFRELRDTIRIKKENVKIKIHHVHDIIYIQAQKDADTVVVSKVVPVERVVYREYTEKNENLII